MGTSTTIITALLAGYPLMAAAIAKLYLDLKRSQEARLREAHEQERILESIADLLKQKKGGK